jgi:PAS domain S-box-containing protein
MHLHGKTGQHLLHKEKMDLPIDNARELGQILEANPIPTFVVDSNSKITHWNRACVLLTDIPAADMIGTDKHQEAFYCQRRELMADLIVRGADTAELSALYGDKVKNSQRTRAGYEGEDFFPKLGKTGKWLFFTAAPLKDANGDTVGAIETLQDITERRLAEQGIRASEARFRRLFESANDAIFIVKDGRIIDCNQKALDLFNASRKFILGLAPMALSPEKQPNGASSEDEVDRRNSIVLQNVPQLFEWRFLRKDGSQFDAEVSLTRFWVSDSPHALAIVRDITARNKMIQTIKTRETELDDKRRYLEKVNQALKAALDHREVEKRAVEENMLINLKRFVFPYIEELGKCQISTDAQAYLNIIETNLNDIVSRLPRTVFSKYIDLTPTEIRIADFIRDGKNSKEMAHLMGLSPSSVQWHRKNIREKLGLTNKKVNLYAYLTSLTE